MLELDISKFYIIGHRGMEIDAVENTLSAFSKAIQFQLDFAECDIQISKDGIPVVFHDTRLDKKTGLTGRIVDHSVVDIQNSYIKTAAGQDKIPTLEKILSLVQNSQMNLIIELKTKKNFGSIHNLIEKYKMGKRVIIDSFSFLYLLKCRHVAPNLGYSWLVPHIGVYRSKLIQKLIIKVAKSLDFVSLSFNINSISKWLVAHCRRQGLIVFAYGVKSSMDYEEILALKINGFTAQDPRRLIEIMKRRT
jgi:glycerophosphoryl diester phosphodiesterase